MACEAHHETNTSFRSAHNVPGGEEANSAGLGRIRHIDALRGIAVLGVVLVHCTVLTVQKDGLFLFVGRAGQRGVQLFFVVSAFTIFYSLDTRKKKERHPIRNFFIRRFFRIAPLFYVAILLALFYHGMAPRPGAPNGLTVFDVLLTFFFLNGFIPAISAGVALGGWTIAVEAMFYALIPLLHKYVKTVKSALVLTLLSGLVMYFGARLLSFHVPASYHEYIFFLSFPIEFPVFCLGILTYFVWKGWTLKDRPMETNKGDTKKWALVLLLIAVGIWSASFPFSNSNLYLTSFGFLPFLLSLSLNPLPLLVNRFTIFIGKISYSLYLMHFFVIVGADLYLNRFLLRQFMWLKSTPTLLLITFAVVLFFSVALAIITHYLIEKPGMDLGKALVTFFEGKQIQPTTEELVGNEPQASQEDDAITPRS